MTVITVRGSFSSGSRASISTRSSSVSRSSSSRASTSSRSSTRSSSSSSASRSTTKAKPGSTVKTSSGKSVKTSTVKPSSSKYKNQAGVTGVDGYTPRFSGGYSAPAGSVVYYPEHSALDYLPWIYLFSQHSPQHDQATVVQPDGKQVVAQPQAGGVDGLAVFNWIMLVVIVLAIIGGVVWGVNKLTEN